MLGIAVSAAIGGRQRHASFRTLEERRSDLAEHDRSLMPNRALAIANAAQGFAEPERFTPGALPLTPFAELDYTTGAFRVLALLKIPALFRVSDADLPEAQTNPAGLRWLPCRSWKRATRSLVTSASRSRLSSRSTCDRRVNTSVMYLRCNSCFVPAPTSKSLAAPRWFVECKRPLPGLCAERPSPWVCASPATSDDSPLHTPPQRNDRLGFQSRAPG